MSATEDTTHDYTDEQLIDLIGPVGLDEYHRAPDWSRPKLDAWIGALRGMSDPVFRDECQHRIYEAALINSFRGNWNHVDMMATACYFESKRRHRQAGHEPGCSGSTIYSEAHAACMRDHGYQPSPVGTCDCPEVRHG